MLNMTLPDDFTLVDGGFDPIHAGHIEYFREAKALGLPVVCLVAPDSYIEKKHPIFLDQLSRVKILQSISYIDFVVSSESTTSYYLEHLKPSIYFKGSDWRGKLPEDEVRLCNSLQILIRYATGPTESSSALLEKYVSKKKWSTELQAFEKAVLSQVVPNVNEAFDDSYFTDSWREHGQNYSIDSRREIEARNPSLIKEHFKPNKVLDAGCGPGALMTFLDELGVSVFGVDASEAVLKSASSAVRSRISIASLTAIPAEDQSFDLVICREVFEHLPALEILRAVTELCRVSSKHVYLTTRFAKAEANLLALETEFDADPTHITCLNQDFLRSLFVLNGFQRRRDLELKLDWLKKGRVLVYERTSKHNHSA